jgi:hypothetical protein
MAVGLIMILLMTGRDARAQWGNGGWGYGGWGPSTPQNAALRGPGYYSMGAGGSNMNPAQAKNINANTAMRYNEYVAHATQEAAYLHATRAQARIHKESERDRALYDAHQRELRENPSDHEIENGVALNAAVADLSNPRLRNSAERAAHVRVPAGLVADAPFIHARDRVTFMLGDLRASVKWPEVFEGPQFVNDKNTFDDLVARMRSESHEGQISPKSLQEAKAFVNALRAKVEAQPLKDPDDQKEASRFLTACTSRLALLDMPDFGPELLKLRELKDTELGNLLGFMHAYNLRFGAATTDKQRKEFHELFAILHKTRNEVLAEANLGDKAPARANASQAAEFFQSLNQARSRAASLAQPPQQRNPQ